MKSVNSLHWLSATVAALSMALPSAAEQLSGDYLMGDADIAFYGTELSGGAGFSVTSAGDFNGDGFDDMLIGIPFTFRDTPGSSYLIYGGPDDDPAPTTLSPTGADVAFLGDTGDNAGFSTSSAGDVNQDGLDDLLIATWPGRFDVATDPATIYLVYGRPDSQQRTTQFNLSSADAKFVLNQPWNVPNPYIRWGFDLTPAGDVDGDGALDLLFGAYWGDPDGITNAGESYLFYGDTAAPFSGEFDLENADAIFAGDSAGAAAGWAVSVEGDLNGDGRSDMVIGAPTQQETFVIYGRPTEQRITGRLGRSDTDAIFTGVSPSNQLTGNSLASAGDVNGDGIDDLLVGASLTNPGEQDAASSAYLLFGRSGSEAWSGSRSLEDADVIFSGIAGSYESDDDASIHVSAAGDVNGDGVDDLIIGAYVAPGDPGTYLDGAQGGRAYLVYGRHYGLEDQTAFDLSDADALFLGGNRYFIGWSMDSAGDYNGDGLADILLGAPEYGWPGAAQGAAFAFYGRRVPEPHALVLSVVASSVFVPISHRSRERRLVR